VGQQDWKTTFIAAAARHHAASHFSRCLRLLDARMLEEAKLCLARDAWRTGLDLTGVPPAVLDRTEELRRTALDLLGRGDTEPVGDMVDELVDLWS
jgi:hypothetical protein